MKKILLITLAIVGLFSCKKPVEPKGEFSAEGNTQVNYNGGEVKLHLTSNVSWKITAEQGVSINPSSGNAGDHVIVATIAPNKEEKVKEFKVTAALTNVEGVTLKKEVKLSIAAFVPDPSGEIKVKNPGDVSNKGGDVTLSLTSNCDWKINLPEGLVAKPVSGGAGEHEIVVTIPANTVEEYVSYEVEAVFTNAEKKEIKKSTTIGVLAFVPDIEATFTLKDSDTIDSKGGDVKFSLTSNCNWEIVVPEGLSATPTSGGAGEHEIVVTIPKNIRQEDVRYEIKAKFTNAEDKKEEKSVSVTIEAAGPDPMIQLSSEHDYNKVLPFYGIECKFTIDSNCDWTAEATDGVVVNPSSGVAGKVEITITLPANETKQDVEHIITYTATNKDGKKYSTSSHLFVGIPYVSDKDGNQYKIVRLKDGRIWMAENMRLIPNGGLTSASSDLTWLDPAFYCPLVISADGSTVDFSRKDEDIKSQGLYYSTARAFGLEDDTKLTAENAESFEGCQGICPDGWHIPTAAEMIALVGKCSNKALTNTEAAYYDATLDNGSLEKLNADGANFKAYGAISVANTAAAKGVMLKVLNADSSDFNTGYFIGSTVYQISKNTDGTLKDMKYYGFMPNVKNGTMNVAYNNYRNGVSLRCIKTQE